MHKNTFFLVLILAVVAALLVGINIGRKFQAKPDQPLADSSAVTPTQSPKETVFTSPNCGISLILPPGTTATNIATNSAQFVSADESVIQFGCQKDIPTFALSEDKIETVKIASMTGTLYHTTSPKDGTRVDALIVKHPTTSMDIYLAGLGSTFSAIIKSIEVLK
jgi:hypothetical protein